MFCKTITLLSYTEKSKNYCCDKHDESADPYAHICSIYPYDRQCLVTHDGYSTQLVGGYTTQQMFTVVYQDLVCFSTTVAI